MTYKIKLFLHTVEIYREFKNISISRLIINMYLMLTINVEIVERKRGDRKLKELHKKS